VIGVGMYLLAFFAFATELDAMACIAMLAAVPFLSRCLSGIATIAFAPGVGKGMLFEFHNSANRRSVLIILITMAVACAIYLLAINPVMALCMVVVALACLGGLRFMSEHSFCGMSGDLAGFFLQMCELLLVACIAITAKMVGL
jgi:adenosylcobinamide-GDP ribazoletransferase